MPTPMMNQPTGQSPSAPLQQPVQPEANQVQGKNAKGQDQKLFDMFMSYAIKIVHSRQFSDNIAQEFKKLKDSNRVIDLIARLTLDVVTRVEDGARTKGLTIPNNVKIHAANQTMGDIITIAEIVGVPKLTDEQKAQAFSLCVSTYLDQEVKAGRLTPEEVQRMSSQIQQTPEGQKIESTKAKLTKNAAPQPQQQGSGLLAPRGGM